MELLRNLLRSRAKGEEGGVIAPKVRSRKKKEKGGKKYNPWPIYICQSARHEIGKKRREMEYNSGCRRKRMCRFFLLFLYPFFSSSLSPPLPKMRKSCPRLWCTALRFFFALRSFWRNGISRMSAPFPSGKKMQKGAFLPAVS